MPRCQPLSLLLAMVLLLYGLPSFVSAQKSALMQEDVSLVNSLKYGSALNATTLNAAVTAIGSARRTLVLATGAWTLSSSVTVPENVHLYIPVGTTVDATGVTLTLNRAPHAEYQDWFLGGTLTLNTPRALPDATSSFVASGCTPSVPSPASLTLGAFACRGHIVDALQMHDTFQAAAAVGPFNAGNGSYWLALHKDTTSAVASWTRQAGTHYLWQYSAVGTEPTIPAGMQLVNEVEVGNGAITTTNFRGNVYLLRPSLYGMIADVKEYGAKCDGTTEDTRAVVAALNAHRLLAVPRNSNCVVSPIILKSGATIGGLEQGEAWGMVGAGVDSSEITGLTGSTGVLIMAGDATVASSGHRRFRFENLKVSGHSGYTACVQIGNAGLGGDGTLVIGAMRNVEIQGCTGADAGGLFIRNSLSLTLDNVYTYNNTNGMRWGTTGGLGAITTQMIIGSQSRSNTTDGFQIYTGNGFTFVDFVGESNGGYGCRIHAITGQTLPSDFTFTRSHFEGNPLGSCILTSDNAPGVGAPANVVFEGGVFTKGTNADEASMTIQDGRDITMWHPTLVGDETPVKVLVTVGVPRVAIWYPNRAGVGEPPSYGDAVTQIDQIYTTDRAGLEINGQLIVDVKVAGTGVNLLPKNFGAAVRGPTLQIGRNTSAGLESAGIFRLMELDGIESHFWVDNAGLFRILSGNSPPSVADTAGTVVGDQTSSLASKNVLGEETNWKAALATVLGTPIYRYTYRDGRYNRQVFTGLITDYSPWAVKDREPLVVHPTLGEISPERLDAQGLPVVEKYPAGKSLNEQALFGHLILALKELERRLAIQEARP